MVRFLPSDFVEPSAFAIARSLEISAGEDPKGWPVRTGSMSPGVLPESYVSFDERSFRPWKLRCAEILLAQEFVSRPGCLWPPVASPVSCQYPMFRLFQAQFLN
jgi:hypothetical protein